MVCGVWCVVCVVCGVWCVVCGLCGVWCVWCGVWESAMCRLVVHGGLGRAITMA